MKRSRAQRQPTPVRVSSASPGRAVAVAAALLLALASVAGLSLSRMPYPAPVLAYWLWGGAVAGTIATIAAFSPIATSSAVSRWSRALLDRPSPTRFGVFVAALATALSVAFAFYAMRRAAMTSDEVAQLWHAKVLLTGRLFLPPDPNPEFFALETVVDVDRWYSQFPIGGPLVLTVGALLGAPWVVNPILCGAAALALYHFARRAFGEAQGRAVALLFSLTPIVLMMAGTWMNHVVVLALAAGVLAALVEWERASSTGRRVLFAVPIGIALGAMFTVRPLDAVIVASVVGVFQLWIVRRDLVRLRELALQAVGGVVAVTPLLYANAVTTGSPTRFGYEVMWGAGHRIGFHADPYGNVHTIDRALEFATRYVSELNTALFEWPVPGLAVAIVSLLVMRQVTRWDVLLLGLFGVQVAAYASYWAVGEFLGPRFLYTALPALIIPVARTPFVLGERFGDRWRRGALAFIVSCVVISWTAPTSVPGTWGIAKQVRATRPNLRVDVASAVREANIHHAVVFMREPFGSRLHRRLWGVGMPRADAARLVQKSDACSLLSALRAAEADTVTPRALKPAAIVRATTEFVPSRRRFSAPDRTLRISSAESVTPECAREISYDQRRFIVPFGQALPLEPITADGRVDGDVIYVADLGERNDVLRARFGDRAWYRLAVREDSDGALRAQIVPY